MQQISGTIGGRYILERKLGEGGMGVVYQATDRLTQETVALKQVTIPAEQLEFTSRMSMGKSDNFRLALASLRHPNIISVLDYGFDARRQPYLTMELLEDAPNLIEAGRKEQRPKQITLLVQVLQALAYLHRRGIIHRDLKPDNVSDNQIILSAGQISAGHWAYHTGSHLCHGQRPANWLIRTGGYNCFGLAAQVPS
jgi:serine/threonine protein kinase